MPDTISQPPEGGRRPTFAEQTIFAIDQTDSILDMLERRVVALEEVAAARCPACARRRLGRALRWSIAGFGWAGPSFAARRMEAVTTE